ncbi:unnamed protein product [Cylindrotheca closterium]|uniref:Uncharacterized protein n=1 Tax=Cylindrotheca closterium TaxID=2856 RepID=A0AAD2PX59_9STRA|nr:unnamed protein product [Cylindrotheca closterium]
MEKLIIISLALFAFADADNNSRVTQTVTRNLRGRVTITSEHYPDKTEEGLKQENLSKKTPLVDHPHKPNKRHGHALGHLQMHKMAKDGHLKHVDVDLEHWEERTDLTDDIKHEIEDFIEDHEEEVYGQEDKTPLQTHHHGHAHGHLHMHKMAKDGHLKHVDVDLEHWEERNDLTDDMVHEIEDFIEDHDEVVHGYEDDEGNTTSEAVEDRRPQEERANERLDHEDVKEVIVLPTGMNYHYNQSLYDDLLTAPFDIYSEIFQDLPFDSESSFPVFAIPGWQKRLGVFSCFGKVSESFIFENLQFLLQWKDILGASDGVSMDLYEYMTTHEFEADLIIAKGHKGEGIIPHLALVISYYQFGTKKKVLIPFARIGDFFDDTSEKHLADEEVKEMELEALHEMIQSKRSNSTLFSDTHLAESTDLAEGYATVEALHFQKLFQLLIRRSFLFSFGYADCLMQDEPDNLRKCLDDTFIDVVKLETTVRGALDDQVVEMISIVNERSHVQNVEACVSFQNNMGSIYEAASCSNMLELGSVVTINNPFRSQLQ